MIYFYARTDNRKDLDRLRRSVALAKEFEEVYFMATDFRAASYAKSLGIKKAVGIEDFRNIAQICQRGDTIVFDSDEHLENDHVHQEMIDYFGRFVRISYDPKDQRKEGEILISPYLEGEGIINGILVDRELFDAGAKEIERLFFWGDADYEKRLAGIASRLAPFGFTLLEGLYFFAGYEEELAPWFEEVVESDRYLEAIKSAKSVVSASPQSALEAVAAGAKTLYWPKEESTEYDLLLKKIGIERTPKDSAAIALALERAKEPDRAYLQRHGVKKVAQALV